MKLDDCFWSLCVKAINLFYILAVVSLFVVVWLCFNEKIYSALYAYIHNLFQHE